jgi:hypothetical protein
VAQRGLRSLKQAETNAVCASDSMGTPRDEKGHNPLVLPATTLIRDVYRNTRRLQGSDTHGTQLRRLYRERHRLS